MKCKIMSVVLILVVFIVFLCACADNQLNLPEEYSSEQNTTKQTNGQVNTESDNSNLNENEEILQSFQNDPNIDKVKTLTKEDKVYINAFKNAFVELGNENTDVINQILESIENSSQEGNFTQRSFYSMIGVIINVLNQSDKTHETIDEVVLSNLDEAIEELESDGATDEEISYFSSLKTLYIVGKENTYNEFENPETAIDKYLKLYEYSKITVINDVVAFVYNEEGAGHLVMSERSVEDKIYYSVATVVISCEFSKVDKNGIANCDYPLSMGSISYGLTNDYKEIEPTVGMNTEEIQVNGKSYCFFYKNV